jgi:ankyrin repeat protein
MQSLLRPFVLLALFAAIGGGCSGPARGAIDNANRSNSYELMMAAAAAQNGGRLEDTGFLFLAGQARFQIDKQIFPPVAQGGDSPGVLKAALSATIGQDIQPALTNDPVAFANAVAQLAKWSPEFGNGYDPGWEYQSRLDDAKAAAVVSATLKPILSAAQSKAKLLQNDEYVKLSQELKEAAAAHRQFLEAFGPGGNPSDEAKEQLRRARERKNDAARRLKEIEFELSPETRWHALAGWKAEDYFDNQQVVELCRAIEANDVAEMERLIAAGADVKAVGKGGMTPLLWALPDRKLERFRCLLEHGADPNVTIESDFGVSQRPLHPHPAGGAQYQDRGCPPGQSVTHLAARSPEIEYLKLVLAHGGDPNIVDKETGAAPIDMILSRQYSDVQERVELLLAKGADLNHDCEYYGGTPAMLAVKEDLFKTAVFLLNSGADPKLYRPASYEKLVHFVVRVERRLPSYRAQLAADYQALVEWLENHGESVDAARAEDAAWTERIREAVSTEGIVRVRRAIIQEQKRNGRPDAAPLQP